jgi:hypothetical protein
VHELCPVWSAAKRYKVAPAAFTRIFPKVGLVVEPMTVAGAVVAFEPVVAVLETADVPELQAAATSPTARRAATASRRETGRDRNVIRRWATDAPGAPCGD